jgi:hypothetical protein
MQPGGKRKCFLPGGPPERVKEIAMTRTLARLALLGLALGVSISAFAGSKAENLTLLHDTQLAGTTIPAGEYKVKYDASGSTCLVKVMKGSKTVATANGELKQLDKKPEHDQIKLDNGNGGAPALSEMDFHDSSTAIVFSTGAATTASGQ